MPSPTNLKLIAQGNTAEIYDYAPDKILKLFRPNFPIEFIRAEYEKSKLISQKLPNTPRVYNLTTYNTRRGIIYEKVADPSMISAMLKSPHKLKHNSRQLAHLHFAIHSRKITHSDHSDSPYLITQANQTALPSVKTKLATDIDAAPALTFAEKSTIKSHLHPLPDGDSLLHFDFHPGNILLRPINPAKNHITTAVNSSTPSIATPIIIDWMTACVGAPCADVARTYLLLEYGELAHANLILRKSARPFEKAIAKSYLAEYLRLSHLSPADVEKWLLPVAAARLREWITPHERKQLLRLIRSQLATAT